MFHRPRKKKEKKKKNMLEGASLDVVCGYAGSAVPYTTLSLHQHFFYIILEIWTPEIYSEISEQRTLWDPYKKWILPCIEAVL